VCILLVYLMCGYNYLNMYGYFLYMLHVYVYCYFGVNMCSYRCICLFMFYIYVFTRALCVYILIACNSKNLCGIVQLDVGYVTICSTERT
jgi:hypothetical protein